MSPERSCPICFTAVPDETYQARGRSWYVLCRRCGELVIDGRLIDDGAFNEEGVLRERNSRVRVNASSWLHRQSGIQPIKGDDDLHRLATITPPGVLDRALLLLSTIEKHTESAGQEVNVNSPEFLLATWSRDRAEITGLLRLIEERGFVSEGQQTVGQNGSVPARLTAKGWGRIDELRRGNLESVQGFVAMSFSPDLRQVYDRAIALAISDAGYQPHRVDDREHTGKIDDEIVAQIRSSRFIVADYTEQKPGVYWEAGFAKGLGLEVIFTCHADSIDDLHFDVRQYNTIGWTTEEELRRKLRIRIEAVLGRGPIVQQ